MPFEIRQLNSRRRNREEIGKPWELGVTEVNGKASKDTVLNSNKNIIKLTGLNTQVMGTPCSG